MYIKLQPFEMCTKFSFRYTFRVTWERSCDLILEDSGTGRTLPPRGNWRVSHDAVCKANELQVI